MEEHPFKADPGLAALVARYIASTSLMELLLSTAFSAMIEDNGSATHAIFHHVRNLSDRIAITKDLADILPKDHPIKAGISPLIDEMIKVNALRNKLAHGVYTREGRKVGVITWLTSKNRKSEWIEINSTFLQGELDKANALNQSLTELGLQRGPFSLPYKSP